MAKLRAVFTKVRNRAGLRGETMPALDLSSAVRLADLTTSGTSQRMQAVGGGDWTAPDGNGFLWLVSDGNIEIAAGVNPTASATVGFPLTANVPVTLSIADGHKIAARDAV